MKKILIVIGLISSINAMAQLDLNIAAQLRSYPSFGGGIYLETGYNFVFWESNKEIMYGLIRPSVYLDSSIVINTYGSQIGFYPISILGVEFGKETTDSNYKKFTYYDCEDVDCEGTMNKNFIRYKLALGAGNFVFTSTVGFSQNAYDYGDNDKPVAEFVTATLASPEEDSMYNTRYVIGHKAIMNGFLGVVADYNQLTKTTQTYKSTYMIYGKRTGLGSISLGAGKFESDEVKSSSVVYLRWSFWPLPTRRIF